MKSLFSMVVLNFIWIIYSLWRPIHNSPLSLPHSGNGQVFLCLDRGYTALFIIILGLADISTPHFWIWVLRRNYLSDFPDLFPCFCFFWCSSLSSQPAWLSKAQCTLQLPVNTFSFPSIQLHIPLAAKFHPALLIASLPSQSAVSSCHTNGYMKHKQWAFS